MDQLFCLVQNLMSLGYTVSLQARTVDERTFHITLHYQTGEPVKGLIGEDNVRMFRSPGCACDHLYRVFSSVLHRGVRHA